MLGSPSGPGGPPQRGIWSLAQAPVPTATSFTADGFSKYGVYSLFPGGPAFGSALYSHARTIEQFTSGHFQQSVGNPFHPKADSLFSSAGYMFGAPTPPPCSPFSPVPMTQLDLFTKGFNSNIIIQQPPSSMDFSPTSPCKKTTEKRCDEKCCTTNIKLQKSECSPCESLSSVNNNKNKFPNNNNNNESGCSRTNPIEWCGVNVKKEPGFLINNPCQVAEITTSNHNLSPVIKLEVTSPKNGGEIGNGNNIPLGIAVGRHQRYHHEVIGSPSLPPAGLLTTVNAAAQVREVARIAEMEPSSAAAAGMAAGGPTGGVAGGGTVLQCSGEDRSGALAAWPMGGAHNNSALTTPTLWQYPAPVPMEPMVPLPVPMPPVGFQLVRDPTTGGLLLLPTTGLESLHQAVVWPSYHQPPPVLLPPMPPPPPLQLLTSTTSDYLSSSTTLHQNTQTHSTRLLTVTTDNTMKRKIPMPIPTTTLIKIETDAANNTMTSNKTLQAVSTVASNTGTVFTDPNMTPLLTTHVIYQHPTTNLILSSQPQQHQTTTTTTSSSETTTTTMMMCRSQATSPVTSCLTPPPDEMSSSSSTVQDASNQTDSPICSEDDTTIVQPETEDDYVSASNTNNNDDEVVDTSVPDDFDVKVPNNNNNNNNTNINYNHKCEQPEQDPEISSHGFQFEERDQNDCPDLSGLQLLSNSIVELEREEITTASNNNLGGLDLLCALAEQRILEENITNSSDEKRNKKRHLSPVLDEPIRKKKRRHHSTSHEKRRSSESDKTNVNDCDGANYRSYKSPESEQEVRKFIASKTQSTTCCDDKISDWPCMNEMELDMRMKLADLQRQYREKQKELSKLKPKKHNHDECQMKKRQRKKSTSITIKSPTPVLQETPIKNKEIVLKPPIFTQTSKKVVEPKSPKLEAFKQSDRIINDYKNDLLRQAALEELELSSSSPEKNSSSKKRKVGRPKKFSSPTGGNSHLATETIVAKKPKNSFVGFLLAAKEKLKLQQNLFKKNSPPRYVEDSIITSTTHHGKMTKKNKNNNDVLVEEVKSCKIRPKLKAEPTIKEYTEEEDAIGSDWDSLDDDDNEDEGVVDDDKMDDDEIINDVDKAIEKSPESTSTIVINKCILTSKHLEIDKLRVLTAMGGLFYAGHLNAVQPPDVYSITLDGERGNRPHIMSREEILRDAIVEIAPKTTDELTVGTRLCAYWSQQYRCLYPGSVAEPGTPNPGRVSVEFDDGDNGSIALEDIRLLPPDYPIIEYDPNPLMSLCKRRRRTSASVSIDERRPLQQQQQQETIIKPQIPNLEVEVEKENKDVNKPEPESLLPHHHNNNKERKRLKKKKRDKLKQKLIENNNDPHKKKKKHRCANEEFCKHKKHHKKHRKHKKNKHHHVENKVVPPPVEVVQLPVVVEVVGDEIAVNKIEIEKIDDDLEKFVANPEDEVTMDDILEATQSKKTKKIRDRQESCESRSKMSAFLPARQLWSWCGKGYKRSRAKGRSRKQFYRSIQRGKETITVGDSAVFLSTGRPDRPYIGKIEAMWEICGTMVVRVKWFYHPEETVGCPLNLKYPGALFESPHVDENDVQTIAHKCEVLPLNGYTEKLGDDPERYAKIYDNNDIYYLAGYYDPTTTTMKLQPEIPFNPTD